MKLELADVDDLSVDPNLYSAHATMHFLLIASVVGSTAQERVAIEKVYLDDDGRFVIISEPYPNLAKGSAPECKP